MILQRVFRLAVLNSHPVQYFTPFYRRLHAAPDIDLTVLYCSRQGLDGYRDPEFGHEICWDVSLLDGYKSVFLRNLSPEKTVHGLFSLINPSVVGALRRLRPDALIVHGHNHGTTLLAIATAHVLGIPVLIRGDQHPMLRRGRLKRLIRKPLMTAFYARLSGCLAGGTKNAEDYANHGVPARKLFHMPYAVDNAFFASGRLDAEERGAFFRAHGLSDGRPVILFVSKMSRNKRARDLLEVYRRLRAEGTDAQLVLVGDGEERPALEQLVVKNRLSDVHFPGFQNQSRLPAWYGIADVFVLPAENEAWGLVINEALSAGVPVVTTTAVGAAYDLVLEGETGYVVAPGDLSGLQKALRRIVTDRDLRERMRARALRLIGAWSYEHAVEGIRAALRTVCK